MATGYNVRVGDADRESIASQLREHFADGRLTLEELNERLDQTFAARTRADLNVVMRDLPHVAWQGTQEPAWPVPAARSGWDHDHGTGGQGQGQRRPFFLAPLMALAWLALIVGAVTLFGIGGDKPLVLVLIFAAFAFLRRLIGFGGRGRGPRGRKGPRRGPRGPRF